MNNYISQEQILKEFYGKPTKLHNVIQKVRLYGETGINIVWYEKPVIKGNMRTSQGLEKKKEKQGEKRGDSIGRTKKNIYMLARANFDPRKTKFITLTYASPTEGIKESYKDFNRFMKRLRYWKGHIKYIAVAELTKNKRIHFHIIAEMPYIANSELSEIWNRGFVKVTAIDHVDNLGAYLVKYIGKSAGELQKLNEKIYYRSADLNYPREIEISKLPEEVSKELELLIIKENCRCKKYQIKEGNWAYSIDVNPRRMKAESYDRMLKLLSIARFSHLYKDSMTMEKSSA